ncbi:hypothetical protein N7452_011475 [Penicillium brevicompactum]|uniref:Uncharacterized protein n=1 Tax=Penicillium brevicompactum TaxID=5074 RepID=A0A9W9Q265_PENBR|nr:hypothetical protein N7452_011475 [Penicillium brevicompactum]
MSRNISYGRGGAGNITRQQSAPTPKDLVTPTIKQEVYTTGRGGSGNMVHNDPDRPDLARESQDVEVNGYTGGAANAYIPTAEEEEHEKKIQEHEAELMRVRTLSKERVKEIEHERQELRRDSPAS